MDPSFLTSLSLLFWTFDRYWVLNPSQIWVTVGLSMPWRDSSGELKSSVTNCCDWYGISCWQNGSIGAIILAGNGMGGTIPGLHLSQLPHLQARIAQNFTFRHILLSNLSKTEVSTPRPLTLPLPLGSILICPGISCRGLCLQSSAACLPSR